MLHIYIYIYDISSLRVKGKGTGKVHPRTGHDGTEWEWSYSSTLSLTLRLLMSYIYGAPILDVSRSHTIHMCACLMYLSVGCLVVNCSQPNIPQTSRSGTHTHRQHYNHIPNKQRKQAQKVVTALSTKDDPLKMVKQL